MKARVKESGEIVEVHECCVDMYLEEAEDLPGRVFHITELDFDNLDYPDYWTRLEHQYAGMAMQGLIASKRGLNIETDMYDIPYYSQMLAHALVEKLKKKEERK